MDRLHQQAHAEAAAPPPTLSLVRINTAASVPNGSSSVSTTDRRLQSSSMHLLTSTMSAAFASSSSSAGAHADTWERGYPMTPVLTASFPSQRHGKYSQSLVLLARIIDPERAASSEATPSFPYSSSASTISAPRIASSSAPRLRLNHERHTPQWFTAAPLLTQFYSQSSSAPPPTPRPSLSQQQQHPIARLVPPATTTRRLIAPIPPESHRFPTQPPAVDSLQRQQRQSPLPPSHTLPTNGNTTRSSSPEHPLPPIPTKKRKRAPAFRLRNFLCMHPGCGKSFTDNAHLRDHTFVHTGEKNLSCELCGKKFARLSTLHDHQRVHSGEKPYACTLSGCSKRYSSRAALRFHVAGHTSTNRLVARRNAVSDGLHQDEGQYEAFPQSAAHHHHESRQSLTGQHHQPENGTTSETQLLHAKLRRQETQIAELQAQLHKLKRKAKTSKTTTTSSTAASLTPPMIAPVVYLMDGMKPFQCFVCYRRFANYYQLSFHAKQHPDASIADVTRNQEPLPVGPKYCPESDCEYSEATQKPLKNLQTLKRHWQRRHQLARPYVCAMCSPANPKSFKTKENLKAHEKECAKTHGSAAGIATTTTHREIAEAM
ncbi:hypothetical protein FI667_g3599, partial [Globisporangium splendens]